MRAGKGIGDDARGRYRSLSSYVPKLGTTNRRRGRTGGLLWYVNLNTLDLRYNYIGAEGVQALSGLANLTSSNLIGTGSATMARGLCPASSN